ncbi:MAG TPA: Ldh family oxidoreductase [Mycobacteriales bacterium]|nr:Ldh family oxidoreductase [Mycobacteriales bacterium]
MKYSEGHELAEKLLLGVSMPAEAAARSATALVTADAWGIGSHGLRRLPHYLERFVAGGMRADAELSVVIDCGAAVTYDGNTGLGHPQVWQAADTAADRCAEHGVGVVSVGNSNHCGSLGIYTYPIIERGYIALIFSNGPAAMAPWGGDSAVLSTSPIAAGVPCRPTPVIVDMATSTVARGKVAAHAKRGERLPDGWAVDQAGAPTNDPQAALAGMLAPLGGGKGYALALMVEALTGGAVGPALAGDVPDMFDPKQAAQPQQISHLILALDPGILAVDGKAPERLDALAARIVAAGGRIPGAGRIPPGRVDASLDLQIPEALDAELREWERRLSDT